MYEILKTAFGTFALLSSIAHALPNPSSIDVIVRIDDDVSTPKYEPLSQETLMVPEDIHTTEEFDVTLMFDEVITDGNWIWPDGYGNLEWSTNHYIFNQSEQRLFPRNRATSPPNLLYVQDSSHSGDVEPHFQVRPNSPAQSFDLHGFSILPYTATPKAPILFSIRGYPANGGEPIVRWYKWTWDAQLQYPWDTTVEGVNFVNKVEIFVVPGSDTSSKERLPYTIDNIKISWRYPQTITVKEEDVVVIENRIGLEDEL